MATETKKPCLRWPALIRRARWLEKKISEGERPGGGYDNAEYTELLLAFQKLGVQFTPADERTDDAPPPRRPRPKPVADAETEEPPVRPDTPETRGTREWVPGEPRGRRYIPGGI